MNQHLPIKIHIDKKLREASKTPMTGAELKALGEVKPGMDLFQKIPGKDDNLINDTDSIDLTNGDQFYSAPSSLNPGTHAA